MSVKRLLFLLAILFSLPSVAAAALEVEFESTPLFEEAGILPGDAVTRSIAVTNTGDTTELVEFDFLNVSETPLAEVMELVVVSGEIVLIDDGFSALFSDGPHVLGNLPPGESAIFEFTAALPPEAGNAFQEEWFGFDLRIGFRGGEQAVDRPQRNGGRRTLSIFDEAVEVNELLQTAFVSWDSTRPATTYLICGLVDDGPYLLTEDAPLYGYSFSLEEKKGRDTSHVVAVENLTPGEYECRPAGRENPTNGFTVGDAVSFTFPTALPGQVAGISTSKRTDDIAEMIAAILESRQNPAGSVLGMYVKAGNTLGYDEFRRDIDSYRVSRRDSRLVDEQELLLGDRVDAVTAHDDNSHAYIAFIALILLSLGAGGVLVYLRHRRA